MKKIILFSAPTSTNIEKISKALFPIEFNHKNLAYMPSNGKGTKQEYTNYWKKIAHANESEFVFIDNTITGEQAKLLSCNILLITGGNTFTLLNNLRNSGLDKTIKEFVQRTEFILAGFSAGAIVLSPTIQICNLPNFDENIVGLTDLTGLNIIDFEVFPHYEETRHKAILENYRKSSNHDVKEITDDSYVEVILD